jgi:hypothetical protein
VRGKVLVLLAIAGCRGGCARTEATPDAAEAPSEGPRAVAHDCRGLAPDGSSCGTGAAPWDELLVLGERLTEIPARHTPPPDEWWAPFDAALAGAEAAGEMGEVERIHVQNAALFLEVSAAQGGQHALAGRAKALVQRLAFPPGARPESIDVDPAIAGWIGPRETWVERTRPAPLMHEAIHAYTRVFRLVRTPALHANFSQLVAVDTSGAPFVTRVIGSLEIRRGETEEAAACVALPVPARVRCGAGGGLAPASLSDLPSSHFLARDETGHLRCNGCHGSAGAMTDSVLGLRDLHPAEAQLDLATRRAMVLDRLREALQK